MEAPQEQFDLLPVLANGGDVEDAPDGAVKGVEQGMIGLHVRLGADGRQAMPRTVLSANSL
jgi:hypothetical protein